MNNFELARLKYKPEKIKYLLVAETPPKSDSKRFFYFEKVEDQDSLFIETMKLLYPAETENVVAKTIRGHKKAFLEMFKRDGFYLIDSLDSPFEERYPPSKKVRLIKMGQRNLLVKIRELSDDDTKVILIAAPVYEANFIYLSQNGVNVINTQSIDFPGSGGQIKYKEKMKSILN